MAQCGDGVRGGQPRWIEIRDAAEIQCGLMNGQTVDGGPEIQGIAVGTAGEAVIDLASEMHGDGAA